MSQVLPYRTHHPALLAGDPFMRAPWARREHCRGLRPTATCGSSHAMPTRKTALRREPLRFELPTLGIECVLVR